MDVARIIGLGYVGLPIIVKFEKKIQTISYEIKKLKIIRFKKNKKKYKVFSL
jgi:UDP-N-acetyl-D-mannosaminuronate dehydrogenase